jgi:hypothetical protein
VQEKYANTRGGYSEDTRIRAGDNEADTCALDAGQSQPPGVTAYGPLSRRIGDRLGVS